MILSLKHTGSQYELQELHELQIDMKPITMNGDLLALSDEVSQTVIWNLETGSYGLLQHSVEDSMLFQVCVQKLLRVVT